VAIHTCIAPPYRGALQKAKHEYFISVINVLGEPTTNAPEKKKKDEKTIIK
jgi:hypothetical protein